MISYDGFAALIDKTSKEEVNPKIYARIATGREWRREFCLHVSTIVKSFIDGAMDSQPMTEKGYSLPHKLDQIANWISFMLCKNFEKEPVISISVANSVSLVRQWASDHPDFKKWELDKEALFTNMAMRLLSEALTLEHEKMQCRSKAKTKEHKNAEPQE